MSYSNRHPKRPKLKFDRDTIFNPSKPLYRFDKLLTNIDEWTISPPRELIDPALDKKLTNKKVPLFSKVELRDPAFK